MKAEDIKSEIEMKYELLCPENRKDFISFLDALELSQSAPMQELSFPA